ncbi:MAG: 2OG-Fe(II) oxygenase [Phenylobacterium sp.]
MTHLLLGEAAPWFIAQSHVNPKFAFSSLGGRYVLLGFLPDDGAQAQAALATARRHQGLLDDEHLCAFLVTRDPATYARETSGAGLRWFLDTEGAIGQAYGVAQPMWFLLDPSMRLLSMAPLKDTEAMFARLEGLEAVDDHAGVPLHAPVMIVPRIFEPDLCRRLIAHYEAQGGAPSGVMREVDGKTVGVLDDFKKRRDASIEEPAFRDALRARIERRLLPEIRKAYQFRATRIERYIVACYDAAEGGYFRPHRDNTTKGTAHRRFAVSINLNAHEFEGGDLRFPEFGQRTYRPPTGGAVVFSCSLLHEATPVTRGRRYAFLPFLYDEAGDAIRRENLQHLVLEPVAEAVAGGMKFCS